MRKRLWSHFIPSLTKDFILIYRISVVGIFIVSCLFVKFSLDQEKEKIEEKAVIAAEQIEKTFSYNVDYLKYQLHYAANQIKEEQHPSFERIARILSSFVNGINNQIDIAITWNAFSWIDKNNKISVDGVGGVIRTPVDVSLRDYLRITTTNPEEVAYGEPVSGALSGRLIIPIGMGVFSEQNQYWGTLVFGLDVEKIIERINKIIGEKTFSFAVMRDDKIAIASHNFDQKNFDEVINNFGITKMIEGSAIVSQEQAFLLNSNFVVMHNIKNSPFKVVLIYDYKKSYSQLANLVLRQLFFILLVIFACVILFQRIYHRIVKPVSQLSQLALKISKKDFAFNIDKPKSNELLDLYNILHTVREASKREQELLARLELTNVELSRANEAKAEFLAKSSHDIKNYIFGISGLSRIILSSKNKVEILQNEELQMVETIADQSEELMHFVEDLLDTNQIDVGDFALDKMELCNIEELIERIVLLNKSLAMRHHIVVRTEIEEDLPPIVCDVRRMKQIMVNLIINAIKYSKEKTDVTIKAKYLKIENQIYVEVIDQGIGMDESEIAMVMSGKGRNIIKSDFSTVDSHGIGMPIVLRLMELHKGKIEIDSIKGEGTRVKLFLNLTDSELNNDLAKFDHRKENHLNKAILLVEDNPTNIKITSKILHDAGYRVISAENGQDAVHLLEEEKCDLVLMDGEMPVMNGYEATAQIREGKVFRKFKNYRKIPIIALMSSSDEPTIKRALDSGMNAHIEKSTSRTRLLDVIESWLK